MNHLIHGLPRKMLVCMRIWSCATGGEESVKLSRVLAVLSQATQRGKYWHHKRVHGPYANLSFSCEWALWSKGSAEFSLCTILWKMWKAFSVAWKCSKLILKVSVVYMKEIVCGGKEVWFRQVICLKVHLLSMLHVYLPLYKGKTVSYR